MDKIPFETDRFRMSNHETCDGLFVVAKPWRVRRRSQSLAGDLRSVDPCLLTRDKCDTAKSDTRCIGVLSFM